MAVLLSARAVSELAFTASVTGDDTVIATYKLIVGRCVVGKYQLVVGHCVVVLHYAAACLGRQLLQ
jgi:hypothetical protein